ncbi:scarecrow-like protein 8 [Bidens hawaiensis]|uniref:scarecrow-like protein 8 n=1 Tax=Bidens hawaiensis TaxID=980011 RepID=UPI00404944D6
MSSGFPGRYPGFFNNIISGSFIGKRSLAEFQQQNQFRQQPPVYLRNVKPRVYNYNNNINNNNNNQQTPDVSSVSNMSSSSSVSQLRSDTLSRLQQIEKELLFDDEDDVGSGVTDNSDWPETVRKLMNPVQVKKISPSPTTSSSSSCASSSATVSLKQLISDAAEAITDGKLDHATELITRVEQCSNARGTPEQRVGFHVASALRTRAHVGLQSNSTELFQKEHIMSTQLLYDKSQCFKLAFVAANNVIMQTVSCSGRPERNIHVVDFDIGHGLQYVYLIHAIAAARRADNGIPLTIKLTTFKHFGNGGVERLTLVGDGLKLLANKFGVAFVYNVLDFKLSQISKQGLAIADGDVLAVNFAFKLNKFPDESVSMENLRDEILRRVKALAPSVVTVAEKDLNTNTASFTARANEVFGYYETFVDSFDATIPKDNLDRVKIEEGLSRRIVNSVACEGRDRVERCEVFGKWRARLRMAGFDQKPVSQVTVDSLKSKVNSGTRGNPGFSVKEDSGGVGFGWLGRTLTIVSAWQ